MRSSLYMTMDNRSAKKVRYVFNPASENLVPTYVGVSPVEEDENAEDKKPDGVTLASASRPALEGETDA